MRILTDLLFLTLFLVLSIVWFVAWAAMRVSAAGIHLLLVVAIVSLAIHVFRGRATV